MKTQTAAPAVNFDIPPFFRGKINEEQVEDALLWWAQLTGNAPTDWTEPDKPITVYPAVFAGLRNAANGLTAVTRVLAITSGGADSTPGGWLACGLVSAAVALADSINNDLSRLGDRV